ncbi:hypothetical protein C5C66_03555 [Rathayibacter toxicus]|uniref:Uncharacterized protein n=1 Tax=Rathayibacter toxicus TaxID=145458 RepID=A0A0U1PUZ6_9MICO|nr:hypothetical protein VT73_04745 [Rathayibacter toxicus]PPG47899.1 hypothetical protein C5D16_03520 [Rathayibacter toxicus]PPH25040.1 hypothetical protein C5D17_03500 [Rathayibacter toxicus]PPH60961.1 hypothetical protein C5C93_03550 [Rathayibacter toxicus]PPH64773.1 hypothetical protein C5D13_03580 [Rathayibacter toxicus]
MVRGHNRRGDSKRDVTRTDLLCVFSFPQALVSIVVTTKLICDIASISGFYWMQSSAPTDCTAHPDDRAVTAHRFIYGIQSLQEGVE